MSELPPPPELEPSLETAQARARRLHAEALVLARQMRQAVQASARLMDLSLHGGAGLSSRPLIAPPAGPPAALGGRRGVSRREVDGRERPG
jgi:hypothetical protein